MSNYEKIKNILRDPKPTLVDEFSGIDKHISTPKIYIHIMKGHEEGAFLNQLIFWSDKGTFGEEDDEGWFYKTEQEWENEILAKKHTIKASTFKLIEAGLLKTKVKKTPNGNPTLHYRFNYVEFEKRLREWKTAYYSKLKSELEKVPELLKTSKRSAEIGKTIYKEHIITISEVLLRNTYSDFDKSREKTTSSLSTKANTNTNSSPNETGVPPTPKRKRTKNSNISEVNNMNMSTPPLMSPQELGTRVVRQDPLLKFNATLKNAKSHTLGTKTYSRASQLLNELQKGLFHRHELSAEFMKRYDITDDDLIKCWTLTELENALYHLSLLNTEGYWPENKEWLSKLSLVDLLYNPRSQNSWLLAFAKNEPAKLSECYVKSILSRSEVIIKAEFIDNEIDFVKPAANQLKSVVKGIRSIIAFHEKLPDGLFEYGDFLDFCPKPYDFVRHYIKYLKMQKWITHNQWAFLDVSKPEFKAYLDKHWTRDSNALGKPLASFL